MPEDKGKLDIMKCVNADKAALSDQIEKTIKSQHERTIVNGTAGTFETHAPELPKESLNKMPPLKVKDEPKSPMIEKIQADRAKFQQETKVKDWQGNDVK